MKQAHKKLADKHEVSVAQIEKEIKIGQKEEMEHTSDPLEAHKIAMDHIKEDPLYYTKLKDAGLVDSVEKSLSPEQKKKVDKFLSKQKGELEDDDLHSFSESIGISPHEVEEYIYSKVINKSNDKVAIVMREFKEGSLTSHGKPVTDRKQALAIAMSEAGMSKSIVIKNKKTVNKPLIIRIKKAIDFKKKLISLRKRRGETKKQFDDNSKKLMSTITNPQADYDRKYKIQGHRKCHGMDISIENKKGSYRKGKDPDGKPWKVKMNFDYGRIVGSKATDDEATDAYVGPDDTAEKIFVVHQNDPFNGGRYDEDKVFMHMPSRESVIEGYLSQYDRPDFLGDISEFTVPEFKQALIDRKGKMLYKSPIEYDSDEIRKKRIVIRKR